MTLDITQVASAGSADVAVSWSVAGSGRSHRVWDMSCRGVAALLMLVLMPLMIVIALSIRATSRGPALYRQRRVGRFGRTFVLYKFRTMRVGADEEVGALRHLNLCDGPLFKARRDPRLSTVGRWLRRFSLDELPQLWNVVRGDMALVGPRPALSRELDRYPAGAKRRLDVKPGMTGLWQVSGRSDLPWAESVYLDLQYARNQSVRLDLAILLRTPLAVLKGTGAY